MNRPSNSPHLYLVNGNFRRMKHFAAQWASNKPMPSVVFLEPRYREGPGKRANDDQPVP